MTIVRAVAVVVAAWVVLGLIGWINGGIGPETLLIALMAAAGVIRWRVHGSRHI